MALLKVRYNAQAGFGHIILLLFVMSSVAIVGYFMLQRTHALSTSVATVVPPIKPPANCLLWHRQISLQNAVTGNNCVYVEAGTYLFKYSLYVPEGHTLTGAGQTLAILKAAPSWLATGYEGVVRTSIDKKVVNINNLTLDGSNRATDGFVGAAVVLDHVKVVNARCNGLGIVGKGAIVRNSLITLNGFSCPVSPPGAGIYLQSNTPTNKNFAPLITGNSVISNGGPGFDINKVDGGFITNNIVKANGSWAGISLYAASNWHVSQNNIDQPANRIGQPYHPDCRKKLPNGVNSSAIFICQDSAIATLEAVSNVISSNRVHGFYGITIIGNNQPAGNNGPQNNHLSNNNVFGSAVGCIEDSKLRSASYRYPNIWLGNNCRGRTNTQPIAF